MRKAKFIVVLLAFSFIFTLNLTAKAATDEWVTGLVDEDLFFASNLFDGVEMVQLQGNDIQIRGWYWFEGPIMQAGRYIKEAYLEVRTPSIGSTDTEASMTIYGKPSGKGGTPSYYENPSAINGPYTTNSYTVNLSSFVGPGDLHNITVTNILREINQGYYFWDGHDVAFVTLSTDGHVTERTITSEETGYPAKLYVHYGEPDYPPGLPPGGSVIEQYRNVTIWEFPPPDVDFTNMTQTGSPARIHVFNETTFNFTNINKSTSNAALGFFVNETGSTTISGGLWEFNFTVNIDIHSAAQGNAVAWWMMGEDDAIGSVSDVFAGNELILFDLYTHDANYYKFLPRNYGTGAGTGGFSGTLLKNIWYMGRITLTDTSYLFEIFDMTGAPETSCNRVLPMVYDIKTIMPLAAQESVAGSQVDGWQVKEVAPSTFLATDENGTVIQTWNGENFTDIDDLKDFIDTDIIGYPDPENPDPPGWDPTSWLTASRFKLILFIIGMVLLIGSPVYGFAERPEISTWIVLMMNMIVGVALLWSLQTM